MLLDPLTQPKEWLTTWAHVEDGLGQQARGREAKRVAVCFAKADTGIWQARYRVRDAETWVRSDPKRRALWETTKRFDVRWYFVSSTGWYEGMPNVRTFVNSRRIDPRKLEKNDQRVRQLVPDPALVPPDPAELEDKDRFRRMEHLPMFIDPLRITTHDFADHPIRDDGVGGYGTMEPKGLELHGVHVGSGRDKSLWPRPWNVVEPILWLSGVVDGGRS
jgi:hypothetical protein